MDLNLIWPDSEDLFQSIFSADLLSSWNLPPGTLPLPSTSMAPPAISLAVTSTNRPGAESSSNLGDLRSGSSHRAIHGVSEMVSNYSSSLTAALESTSITSLFLDECLHMFFDRFVPIFPIMHRPTFVYRDCSHPLLLNAIAIGSLYLEPIESVAKGEVLWRLAHTAVATSWQTLIALQGPYDACAGVQLVLSALLSVIYGAMSKNASIRGSSQALHASAFFWARQCGIFNCKPYDPTALPSLSAPHEEKLHQWKIWAARQIQERALLSHYVLDGLISHVLGNSTSVRHTSNTLMLPHSERAFHDASVDQWLGRMHTVQEGQTSFRDIYKRLFCGNYEPWMITQMCSNFTLRVLLEGLQSMIADSDPVDGAIINPPTHSEIGQALSWMYQKISSCTDISEVERLEVILRWHAVCLEAVAKTPPLCKYICKRWDVRQGLWPNTHLPEQDYDLLEFVSSPAGRKALLHAVSIQNTVEKVPRGRAHALHMPSSLFAAATIYGVFLFVGQTNVRLPGPIEWKDAVLEAGDLQHLHHETAYFIQSSRTSHGPASTGTSRNVLYELNSIQKLLGELAAQWGVSEHMEKVVKQWIAIGHS